MDLLGTINDDTLTGADGNETIAGLAGADLVEGGPGADRLTGGPGNDTLHGGAGRDVLEGGAGDDLLDASEGPTEDQGDGDFLRPGLGTDTVTGHAAAFLSGTGADLSYGDLAGVGGMIIRAGTDGSGTAISGDGRVADRFSYIDFFEGSGDADLIEGSDDTPWEGYAGLGGADTIHGGGGWDMIDYSYSHDYAAPVPIRLDLALGEIVDVDGQTDRVSGIEHIRATAQDDDLSALDHSEPIRFEALAGDDTVVGGTRDDRLEGGEGGDVMLGHGGADRLMGGPGADWIEGGADDDLTEGGQGDDSAHGGPGYDRLWGGPGDDSLMGDGDSDTLWGEAGDDLVRGGDGDDALWGMAGDDTLSGGTGHDRLQGGSGVDSLRGGDGSDLLLGGERGDTLQGGAGNDSLHGQDGGDFILEAFGDDWIAGGRGDDTVLAGAGNDTILGGLGDDRLQGQEGADRFVVFGHFGRDRIVDFDRAEDLLIIRGIRPGEVMIDTQGTDTWVDIGGRGCGVLLVGVRLEPEDAGLFVYE